MKTNIQNKWRLPAIDELEKVLYPNANKIPNLEKDFSYWSSSEYYSSYAWDFNFYYGAAYSLNAKNGTKQVRAVRDVSPNSTNSSNSTIIGNLEVHNEDLGRMNWYDAVDAVDKLNNIKIINMSKFNEFFSNDPNNDTDAYNENAMLNEYFDKIKSHDYSYQFSDDHRWWESGTKSENRIKEMIHALCTIVRLDAERLLEDSLSEVNEEYVDGLTHKTIRSWFKPYVENVDNIFIKPNL